MLCARPPQGHEFILQFAALARMVCEKAEATRKAAAELPIKKFLRLLGHEQERRVMQGAARALNWGGFRCECYDCAWLSLTALSTVTCNLWL
jgi:hypothetical protein